MLSHFTSTRRRLARGFALGTVLTGVLASSVSAATTQVSVNDARTFTPSALRQAVGGSVHWAASGIDDHSVTQDQLIFDTGAPRAGVDLTRVFSAGTFPYHCRKHGDQGMRGTVGVAPQALPAPAGARFTVRWATAASNTGNRYTVQYRVGSGAWKTWLNSSSARSAVFGTGSRPVRAVAGKRYSFRVRSGSATAKSGNSPVTAFTAR